MVRAATALLLLLLVPSTALAQKRVALVIGNSAYQHTPKLANPEERRDRHGGGAQEARLPGHGRLRSRQGRVRSQGSRIRQRPCKARMPACSSLPAMACRLRASNYLVPIDAKLTTAAALEFEMVRLDVVHRMMERQTNTNMLFLDACRDNPLVPQSGARHGHAIIGDRAWVWQRSKVGVGTLISFSTQPGNVALDGAGRNSPFAGALVKHISTSNDDLSAILIAVRNDVMKETQRKQVPWEHSALTGRFYFGSVAKTRLASSRRVGSSERSSRGVGPHARTRPASPCSKAFISRFKDTYYAELARERIDELKKQQIAVAVPPARRDSALEATASRTRSGVT